MSWLNSLNQVELHFLHSLVVILDDNICHWLSGTCSKFLVATVCVKRQLPIKQPNTKYAKIYSFIFCVLLLLTCCALHPWERCGWFCQNWLTQTPSQSGNSRHPAQRRRGPCAPWLAVPGTSCRMCTGWQVQRRLWISKAIMRKKEKSGNEAKFKVFSLVVLIATREVVRFHGIPAQCVAPHCHYDLRGKTQTE